ncbi:hypothetical protein U1Q18_015034 [Sarracenia purpurea var. burkii]
MWVYGVKGWCAMALGGARWFVEITCDGRSSGGDGRDHVSDQKKSPPLKRSCCSKADCSDTKDECSSHPSEVKKM